MIVTIPAGLVAALVGYVLIWFSIDQQLMYQGIGGGILFGGGVMFGLFGD